MAVGQTGYHPRWELGYLYSRQPRYTIHKFTSTLCVPTRCISSTYTWAALEWQSMFPIPRFKRKYYSCTIFRRIYRSYMEAVITCDMKYIYNV